MFNQGLLEQASLCHQALLYFSSVWCSKNFSLWAAFLGLQHGLFYSVCLYIRPKTSTKQHTECKEKMAIKKGGFRNIIKNIFVCSTAPLGAIQDLPGTQVLQATLLRVFLFPPLSKSRCIQGFIPSTCLALPLFICCFFSCMVWENR